MILQLKPVVFFFTVTALILTSCSHKPEKIAFGKDQCVECKMTIMDAKFGAQIVTKKGKKFKFDDTRCIASFLERRGVELSNVKEVVFVVYGGNDEFVEVEQAEFVVSSKLNSPMGGAAAFKSKADAQKKSAELEGSKTTDWATLYNIQIK